MSKSGDDLFSEEDNAPPPLTSVLLSRPNYARSISSKKVVRMVMRDLKRSLCLFNKQKKLLRYSWGLGPTP